MSSDSPRLIVVGRNSKVWKRVRPLIDAAVLELSHDEIDGARISTSDVVWILSYSRRDEENRRMFAMLADTGARRVVYVSSATANVGERYRCYGYPRAKSRAEVAAAEILGAHVVRLGVVCGQDDELPGGTFLATAPASIADAMRLSLHSGPREVPRDLFEPATQPFGSAAERICYSVYGVLLHLTPTPCLLRPLDLALRTLGWRWYGYVYLSNQQWLSTI